MDSHSGRQEITGKRVGFLFGMHAVHSMFEDIVEGILNKKFSEEENSAEILKVKTNIVLAVRTGPGINYQKVQEAQKGIYTIVEVRYNKDTPWGRLKSGAGWISIHGKYSQTI